MRKVIVTMFLSLDGVMEEPAWTMPYWNAESVSFETGAKRSVVLTRQVVAGTGEPCQWLFSSAPREYHWVPYSPRPG